MDLPIPHPGQDRMPAFLNIHTPGPSDIQPVNKINNPALHASGSKKSAKNFAGLKMSLIVYV
jgi:hypothetical protein